MRKRHTKFLKYFLILFVLCILSNIIFKDNLNVLTAFSVALGVSLGIAYLSPYFIEE